MTEKKPFYVFSDTTERLNIWVPKKSHSKRIICVAGFDLNKHLDLVDRIDQLDYIRVDCVTSVDVDMSYLTIVQHHSDSLMMLAKDLPQILIEYVNSKETNQSETSPSKEGVSH